MVRTGGAAQAYSESARRDCFGTVPGGLEPPGRGRRLVFADPGEIDPETESGLCRFNSVAPGLYILRLADYTGYILIAPASGEHELGRGESDLALNWALRQARRPGPTAPPEVWWAGGLGADAAPGFIPPPLSGWRATRGAPARVGSIFELDGAFLVAAAEKFDAAVSLGR